MQKKALIYWRQLCYDCKICGNPLRALKSPGKASTKTSSLWSKHSQGSLATVPAEWLGSPESRNNQRIYWHSRFIKLAWLSTLLRIKKTLFTINYDNGEFSPKSTVLLRNLLVSWTLKLRVLVHTNIFDTSNQTLKYSVKNILPSFNIIYFFYLVILFLSFYIVTFLLNFFPIFILWSCYWINL